MSKRKREEERQRKRREETWWYNEYSISVSQVFSETRNGIRTDWY